MGDTTKKITAEITLENSQQIINRLLTSARTRGESLQGWLIVQHEQGTEHINNLIRALILGFQRSLTKHKEALRKSLLARHKKSSKDKKLYNEPQDAEYLINLQWLLNHWGYLPLEFKEGTIVIGDAQIKVTIDLFTVNIKLMAEISKAYLQQVNYPCIEIIQKGIALILTQFEQNPIPDSLNLALYKGELATYQSFISPANLPTVVCQLKIMIGKIEQIIITAKQQQPSVASNFGKYLEALQRQLQSFNNDIDINIPPQEQLMLAVIQALHSMTEVVLPAEQMAQEEQICFQLQQSWPVDLVARLRKIEQNISSYVNAGFSLNPVDRAVARKLQQERNSISIEIEKITTRYSEWVAALDKDKHKGEYLDIAEKARRIGAYLQELAGESQQEVAGSSQTLQTQWAKAASLRQKFLVSRQQEIEQQIQQQAEKRYMENYCVNFRLPLLERLIDIVEAYCSLRKSSELLRIPDTVSMAVERKLKEILVANFETTVASIKQDHDLFSQLPDWVQAILQSTSGSSIAMITKVQEHALEIAAVLEKLPTTVVAIEVDYSANLQQIMAELERLRAIANPLQRLEAINAKLQKLAEFKQVATLAAEPEATSSSYMELEPGVELTAAGPIPMSVVPVPGSAAASHTLAAAEPGSDEDLFARVRALTSASLPPSPAVNITMEEATSRAPAAASAPVAAEPAAVVVAPEAISGVELLARVGALDSLPPLPTVGRTIVEATTTGAPVVFRAPAAASVPAAVSPAEAVIEDAEIASLFGARAVASSGGSSMRAQASVRSREVGTLSTAVLPAAATAAVATSTSMPHLSASKARRSAELLRRRR